MGLVQGPDELPLVVFGVSRHIWPRGHHFESHHLQGVEDQPGGEGELSFLHPVIMGLGLVQGGSLNQFYSDSIFKLPATK